MSILRFAIPDSLAGEATDPLLPMPVEWDGDEESFDSLIEFLDRLAREKGDRFKAPQKFAHSFHSWRLLPEAFYSLGAGLIFAYAKESEIPVPESELNDDEVSDRLLSLAANAFGMDIAQYTATVSPHDYAAVGPHDNREEGAGER